MVATPLCTMGAVSTYFRARGERGELRIADGTVSCVMCNGRSLSFEVADCAWHVGTVASAFPAWELPFHARVAVVLTLPGQADASVAGPRRIAVMESRFLVEGFLKLAAGGGMLSDAVVKSLARRRLIELLVGWTAFPVAFCSCFTICRILAVQMIAVGIGRQVTELVVGALFIDGTVAGVMYLATACGAVAPATRVSSQSADPWGAGGSARTTCYAIVGGCAFILLAFRTHPFLARAAGMVAHTVLMCAFGCERYFRERRRVQRAAVINQVDPG